MKRLGDGGKEKVRVERRGLGGKERGEGGKERVRMGGR